MPQKPKRKTSDLPTVELLQSSARKDVLPAICVVTGATEGVEFHNVAVSCRDGRTFSLCLPFTRLAYSRWLAAKILFRAAVNGALLALVGGAVVAHYCLPMGALVFLAGALLPIATRIWMVRGSGPEVERAYQDALLLSLPSAAAAEALQTAINEAEYMLAALGKPRSSRPTTSPRPSQPPQSTT